MSHYISVGLVLVYKPDQRQNQVVLDGCDAQTALEFLQLFNYPHFLCGETATIATRRPLATTWRLAAIARDGSELNRQQLSELAAADEQAELEKLTVPNVVDDTAAPYALALDVCTGCHQPIQPHQERQQVPTSDGMQNWHLDCFPD